MTTEQWEELSQMVWIDSESGDIVAVGDLLEQFPDLDDELLFNLIDDYSYEDEEGNELIDWNTVEQAYEDGDAF